MPGQTAPGPTTAWVAPGRCTLRLIANGRVHEQPIEVKQDPRVQTPPAAMQQV